MKFRDFISGLQLPWYQRPIPFVMRAVERSLEAQSKLGDSIDATSIREQITNQNRPPNMLDRLFRWLVGVKPHLLDREPYEALLEFIFGVFYRRIVAARRLRYPPNLEHIATAADILSMHAAIDSRVRNGPLDRLIRWIATPHTHVLQGYVPDATLMRGVDARSAPFLFWVATLLAFAKLVEWVYPHGKMSPAMKGRITDQELPPTPTLEQMLGAMDIYSLLQVTDEPDIYLLAMPSRDHVPERKLFIRGSTSGFSIQRRENIEDMKDFLDAVKSIMTICHHAIQTHWMISAKVAQATARYLPPQSKLRRALIPMEIGVWAGISQATLSLLPKNGFFHRGLVKVDPSFTYEDFKTLARPFLDGTELRRYIDRFGGTVAPFASHEPPFSIINRYHRVFRDIAALAVGVNPVEESTWATHVTGRTDEKPSDIMTALLMTQVFHNLHNNEIFTASTLTRSYSMSMGLLVTCVSGSTDFAWPKLNSPGLEELCPEVYAGFAQRLREEVPHYPEAFPMLAHDQLEMSTGL